MITLGLACLTLAGIGAAWLPMADIYVDANAPSCATGTGTLGDPVCRISQGVALAAPGDTIRIAPGTYFERVAIGVDLELIGTDGDDVTIVDASGLGGSVVTILAPATVVVDGLTVTGGQASIGGGFRVLGDLTLRNSTVTGNEARGVQTRGGGIGTQGLTASITIENSTICDNLAYALEPGVSGGGGISVRDASLIVSNTTVDSNVAGSQYNANSDSTGGGIHVFRSSLVMSGSTISGNDGGGRGGAVYSRLSDIHLTNTTISANRAFRSPALYATIPTGSAYFGNVTIADNNPRQGLEVVWAINLTIRNTIIADNSSSYPQSVDVRGAITSLGNNLIGATDSPVVSGSGDLNGSIDMPIDPLLGPLEDNGGPTKTHRLLPGSPALDAGSTTNFEPFDQRGLARPLGNASDIGAFELNVFPEHCFGDGGDQMGCTDCPCSNNALPGTRGGCLNSIAASARLDARGTPSVSQGPDVSIDLRFGLQDVPPSAFCILTSADTLAPTLSSNPCFGLNSGVQSMEFDGLRCATSNVLRHGGRAVDSLGVLTEGWGGGDRPAAGIAQAMGGFATGQVRFFQVIYREDSLASCMRGLNTTQAIEVVFTP